MQTFKEKIEAIYGSVDRAAEVLRRQAVADNSIWVARFAVDPAFAERLGLDRSVAKPLA